MEQIQKKTPSSTRTANRLKAFLWNGFLLTAVSLLMRFVGMSFQLFITEHAGSEAVGLYTVIGSVYGFAVTLATSGIQLGATRMISEALGRDDLYEAKEARRVCLSYAIRFGLLATLLLFFGARWISEALLKDPRAIRSLRLLSLSLLPLSVSSALNGYFTAVRKVYKNAFCSLLEQGVRIAITSLLLLYILPKGIESACIALVLGSVLSELLATLILGGLFLWEHRHPVKESGTVSREELRTRLRGIALPVAFSAYARSGLLSIEHMLIPIGLTSFFGDRSAALSAFGILQGISLPILLFPSALLSSYAGLLIPEIAECRVRGQAEKVQKIVTAIFRGTLIFAVGVSGIMLCFSYEIGTVIGKGTEAAEYLRLLAPLIPVMYLDTAADSILKGHGEQVYCMRVNILDSLLSVLLVWLLLPSLGIKGYILVIYIAELINASLSIARLLKVTDMKPALLKILFVPLFSIIGATAFVRLLASFSAQFAFPRFEGASALILHVLFSVVSYLLLLFLLGGIKREETTRLLRKLKRPASYSA